MLVGHGLKTDLRMLNIAVPPEQVLRRSCAGARALTAAFILYHCRKQTQPAHHMQACADAGLFLRL